ncbi:MAG: hypothetical protein ACI3X1_06550 [Eubacteriales bacterium]
MKSKRIICGFLCALMIFSTAPDFCLVVRAEEGELQGGQSNIVNGSFENPNKKSEDSKKTGYLYTPQSEIEGWATTSTTGKIELGWLTPGGTSPHMIPTVITEIVSGIGASDGWQFAETIGNEPSTLYQSLSLEAGMSYNWTVHHRGRSGVDTLALFFVEDKGVNYVKSAKDGSDHFNQIVAWMKAAPQSITAPAAGETVSYTVYTTALSANGAFTASEGGYFSFSPDAEHTVKFEVHLMSTAKTDWGKYTGNYVSEIDGNVLFALTCFKSDSSSETSGNLVDNLSFSSVYDNKNLLKNPGFEDAEVTSGGYKFLNAANHSSPVAKIGWYSTAYDRLIEIGTLRNGTDSYGLGVTFDTVTYNAPSIRDGEQFAELNADQESSLYQIVDTDPGKMYKWSLSHRGRDGLDTMALVIGPNQPYAPQKTSATARDQLMQIVDWLYSQKDVVLDIPERGCSNEIKLYTPKFNGSGGFELSENVFSWYEDETHTEEWSVWIISSDNSKWHDYGEIEEGAAYNYDYIVPKGQENSIFGFVSVKSAPKASNGQSDITYGNFLDNIAFKEYYYIHAKFDGDENFGNVTITPEDPEHFISTDLDSNEVGWSLAGSNITVSFREQSRTFLGAYINGVFHSKDDNKTNNPDTGFWTVTEEGKVYSFTQSTDKALTIKVVYQAKNVIYDTRNNYTYQYDLSDPNSGREVPMGIDQEGHLPKYISHAPVSDDGWEFLGWWYVETDGTPHLVDAVHKVQCDEKTITDESTGDTITVTTLSIWKKGEGDGENEFSVLVDDGIDIGEGITFFAEWKYRQRVIAQTYNLNNSSYDVSTEGGEVDVKIAFTEDANPSAPTDYLVGEDVVGKDIFAAADGTYINITAKNKPGYVFNGWYDGSGNLVSRNPSYTYKVVDGGVLTYYARFELYGHDLTVNTTVDGEEDKYFAVDCIFSSLRENHLYAISGLVSDQISVNGESVNNPTILRADASGNAQVTIYVKNGDSAVFEHLPENCVYSVSVKESSKEGYSVKGEVSTQKFGAADLTIELALKKSKQDSWIAPGKHYQDIFAHIKGDIITITPKSSFTLYVETAYDPSFYTDLSASLCFFNAQGEAQCFAEGTRILMIDKCNEADPSFYCFIVANDSTSEIALTDFTALGSQNINFELPSGDNVQENLLFVVDYVGTTNAPSGKLSLVYRNGSVVTINPADPKVAATGSDATSFTVTAQNENASGVGPFEVKLTISESSPNFNTTYTGYDDDKYSVKLSLDGGTLPEGAYAEVNGQIYHSCNGYIIVSPLSAGEITVNLYSRNPLVASSGEKVKIKAELLSAVSTSASIPVGISGTVAFTCVNPEEYAMDADIGGKVLTPGSSQVTVNLNHSEIDDVKLTVSKKNGNGTYSIMIQSKDLGLPTKNTPVTVNLGSGFKAEAGETYVFSFVGYAGGVPVCSDDCFAVGGYEQ